MSLTSASLADVAPADTGAASGLINVSQQVGAALGLAVLVSAFGAVTHHAEIGAPVGRSAMQAFDALIVHGLHDVFGLGLVFTVLALAIVGKFVRRGQRSSRPERAEVVETENAPELLEEAS